MASRPSEIITRFTVQGIEAARSGFRRVSDSIRDMSRSAAATTADLARRSGAAIKKHFANVADASVKTAKKSIDQTVEGVKKLATATKDVGFSALEKAAKTSFAAIGLAAAAAGAKVAAAIKITQDSATEMSNLDLRRQQTGVSVGDQVGLQYASQMQGTGKDDLITAMQGVSNSLREWERSNDIAASDRQTAADNLRYGLFAARRAGDPGALQNLISQSQGLGLSNLDSVLNRIDRMEKLIDRIENPVGLMGSNSFIPAATTARNRRIAAQLNLELDQLYVTANQLREGLGPAGRAMWELKNEGLDVKIAMEGGTRALAELAGTLEKFNDKQKKEIVRGLFGDLTHYPVLSQGRAEVYRQQREMERYGGVVTDADGERSSRLKAAELKRDTAVAGVKLEIARGISPALEEANTALADWLADNRTKIAVWVKGTLEEAFAIVRDIAGLFQGDTNFESKLFQTGKKIVEWAQATWNTVQDIVLGALNRVVSEIALVLDGGDSNWEWLNVARDAVMQLVDAFAMVKQAVKDVFAVFTGGDAVRFTFLNDARDAVLDFLDSLHRAWEGFKTVFDKVHTVFGWIAGLFGTDTLTAALFLGLMKVSGVLGIILGTVGGLIKGLKALGTAFLLLRANAALGAAGAATSLGTAATAATAAATATGTITAAATGAAAAASTIGPATAATGAAAATAATGIRGIGAAAARVVPQVVALGGALYAGWQVGELIGGKLAEPLVTRYGEIQDRLVAGMRGADRQYFAKKYYAADRDTQIQMLRQNGQGDYGYKTKAEQLAELKSRLPERSARYVSHLSEDEQLKELWTEDRMNKLFAKSGQYRSVNFNFGGGRSITGTFDSNAVGQLQKNLSAFLRNG